MAVSLVFDSTCEISHDEARTLGVDVLPITVVLEERRLRDGIDIDRDALYRRIETVKELPKTEPVTVAEFAAAFKHRVDAGDDVVAMTVSAALSGTFANAVEASRPFGAKVRVVDSRSASMLFRLQALESIAAAKAGGSISDVVAAGDRRHLHGQAYFAIPDVAFLGRTGRLPKPIVALGSLMGVNLVLRVGDDGVIGMAGQSRSIEKALAMIVDQPLRALGDASKIKIIVAHARAPKLAADLEAVLRAHLRRDAEIATAEIGTTSAINLGPGSVGICAIAS